MHKDKRERVITDTGDKDKAVVIGMMERGGNVRAFEVENRTKKELQHKIRESTSRLLESPETRP